MPTPRAYRRAIEAKKGQSIEAQAATARAKRQELCTKELNAAMNEVLQRHHCRSEVVVTVAGQQLPITQVLNFPVALRVLAIVEEA